jgi:MFS family permease
MGILKIARKIPKTVKAVGCASCLLNISTLMVYSIFGLYLSHNVGVSFNKIGFLDGAVESFSFLTKILSGILSDFVINRKILIIIGASFLCLAKPLEAISCTYWSLFAAKVLERFGNGIQATPRDAIVGDWSPKRLNGTCFGIRQAMAAFGSLIGSVVAFVLLKKTNEDFQFVFWVASVPSLLAIFVIILFVNDKKHKSPINTAFYKNKQVRKISLIDIKNLGFDFWKTIGIASTYMIAKVTESLVILYVLQKFRLPGYYAPICMIFYQLANSIVSFSAGRISDRIKSRNTIIVAGTVMLFSSDLLFILGNHIFFSMIALALLGAYIGISQSIFQAKIIDVVPIDLKGTGLGVFNCVCAISLIIGGSLFGYIAERYSPEASFTVGAILALASTIVSLWTKKNPGSLKNDNNFTN